MLAIAAIAGRKQANCSNSISHHKFLILIPAHNEEMVLGKTLLSLNKLEYPKDKYQPIVIADNCTDATARIASEHGVRCLERFEPNNRGKGQALSWAFMQISSENYGAVLILDADCLLDSNALKVFDKHLGDGWDVLQASYQASNPDSSPMSYAVAVGNYIENNLFYAPKSHLGLSVLLRGTGFVMAQNVPKSFPWRAHSVAEDIEYSVALIRNRVPIKFVSEVRALSEFPVTAGQLEVQRRRWADGNIGFSKKNALNLLWEGFKSKNLRLADSGWTFLVLSKPLVLILCLGAMMLSIICGLIVPGLTSSVLLCVGIALLTLILAYIGLGIIKLGLTRHRMLLLLKTPFVVLRLVVIALKSIAGWRPTGWVRTPR